MPISSPSHRLSQVVIALSCVFAVAINLTTFLVVQHTSAVTFLVVGHFKTIMVLILGFAIFREKLTARSLFGICVAVGGMVYLFLFFFFLEEIQRETAPRFYFS